MATDKTCYAGTNHQTNFSLTDMHFKLMKSLLDSPSVGSDLVCLGEAKMCIEIKAAFPEAIIICEAQTESRYESPDGPDGAQPIIGVVVTAKGRELVEQHLISSEMAGA